MTTLASIAHLLRRNWVLLLSVLGAALLCEFMLRVQAGLFLSGPMLTTVKLGRSTTEAVAVAVLCAVVAAEVAARKIGMPADSRFQFYSFVLSIFALSLAVWVLEARADKHLPAEYIGAGALIAALFTGTAIRTQAGPLTCIRYLLGDVSNGARMPMTWIMAGVGIAAIAWAPIPQTEAIQSGSVFEKWFVSQSRVPSDQTPGASVVVTEFVDYQCPYSRIAAGRFAGLFKELAARYGQKFRLVYRDFPLDSSCNATKGVSSAHPSACDAAVAVRIARTANVEASMVDWLWGHQEVLSRASILDELRTLTGRGADEQFEAARQEVIHDVAVGAALGIKQTPSLVINGVVTPLVSATSLRWAVEHEMAAHKDAMLRCSAQGAGSDCRDEERN